MREEKQLLLDEITGLMAHYHHFVIMSYCKLKANTIAGFRGDIAKLGGEVQMVPKRILLKSAKDAGQELQKQQLEGHVGVVFTNDGVEATKFLVQFGKTNEDNLKVLGGKIDGLLYDGAQMERISKLPGMNELRSQFLSVLEAPLSQTLGVMDALLTSIIHCLANKAGKVDEAQSQIFSDDSQCSEVLL